jgi:hypothetical protein
MHPWPFGGMMVMWGTHPLKTPTCVSPHASDGNVNNTYQINFVYFKYIHTDYLSVRNTADVTVSNPIAV